MSTTATNTARIGVLNIARLRETTLFAEGQGYERPLPTGRKLRVILSREADAEIISFTSNYSIEWKARFDSAVPRAVFEAAITQWSGQHRNAQYPHHWNNSGQCLSHLPEPPTRQNLDGNDCL